MYKRYHGWWKIGSEGKSDFSEKTCNVSWLAIAWMIIIIIRGLLLVQTLVDRSVMITSSMDFIARHCPSLVVLFLLGQKD